MKRDFARVEGPGFSMINDNFTSSDRNISSAAMELRLVNSSFGSMWQLAHSFDDIGQSSAKLKT